MTAVNLFPKVTTFSLIEFHNDSSSELLPPSLPSPPQLGAGRLLRRIHIMTSAGQ